MRFALLAALVALAACDTAREPRGTFALALSGARTARLDGPAGFVVSSCRSLSLRSGEASLSLATDCPEPEFGDRFQAGTLRVGPRADSAALRVSFYDDADQRAYRGTGGTVEITAETAGRVTGRLDIELRQLRFDNTVDTTGTPLRIVGTFDALGFAGLD